MFSCPKTLAHSFKLDVAEEADCITNHDWDGLVRIYNAIEDHPLLENALEHSICVLANHHCFSASWRDIPVYYRLTALLKLFENPHLGKDEFFEGAFPSLCNLVASLSEPDEETMVEYWSKRNATELTRIVRNLQALINFRIRKLEAEKLINDDIIIENASKTLRLLFFASLVSGKHESNLLSSEVIDVSQANSMASSMCSSISTIPEEGFGWSRNRRSDSFVVLDRQISEIIRGQRQSDEQLKKSMQDPLTRTLNVDWNTVEKPLVPYAEFVNDLVNEKLETDKDYVNYKLNIEDNQRNFSFISFPYILTIQTKVKLWFIAWF